MTYSKKIVLLLSIFPLLTSNLSFSMFNSDSETDSISDMSDLSDDSSENYEKIEILSTFLNDSFGREQLKPKDQYPNTAKGNANFRKDSETKEQQLEKIKEGLKNQNWIIVFKHLDTNKAISKFLPIDFLKSLMTYICYNSLMDAMEVISKDDNPKDFELKIDNKQLAKAIKADAFNPWKNLIDIDILKNYFLQNKDSFYPLEFARAIKWENAFEDQSIYEALDNYIDGRALINSIKFNFEKDSPIVINKKILRKAFKLNSFKQKEQKNIEKIIDYLVKKLEEAGPNILAKLLEAKLELIEKIITNSLLNILNNNPDKVVSFGSEKLLEFLNNDLDQDDSKKIIEKAAPNILAKILETKPELIEKIIANSFSNVLNNNIDKIENFGSERLLKFLNKIDPKKTDTFQIKTLSLILESPETKEKVQNIGYNIIDKIIKENPDLVDKLYIKATENNNTSFTEGSKVFCSTIAKAISEKDSIQRAGSKVVARYIQDNNIFVYSHGTIALLAAFGGYICPKTTATIIGLAALTYYYMFIYLPKCNINKV